MLNNRCQSENSRKINYSCDQNWTNFWFITYKRRCKLRKEFYFTKFLLDYFLHFAAEFSYRSFRKIGVAVIPGSMVRNDPFCFDEYLSCSELNSSCFLRHNWTILMVQDKLSENNILIVSLNCATHSYESSKILVHLTPKERFRSDSAECLQEDVQK